MIRRRQVFMKPRKSLGQCFLTNQSMAIVAAEHAEGKRVLELGPGYGILTRELCERADRVVAVEIDRGLFGMLKTELNYDNLTLINKDFFSASADELLLADTDIMIANVPYGLSSRVLDFLLEHRLQAVLFLQKEFAEHMSAEPGSRKYSRLSVMSQLGFSVTKIMDVPRGNFNPAPKVDSIILYIKPKDREITSGEKEMINLLMQHKKKTVRASVLDSFVRLGVGRKLLGEMIRGMQEGELRVFQMDPEEILALAKKLEVILGNKAPAPGRV
ncbi:putative ribosomal RNA small subunit methyltransferase A [uncultured archaeon]|nr:putative ribosomal RNA small subunit methyltransferase A [uncultured archaeon]